MADAGGVLGLVVADLLLAAAVAGTTRAAALGRLGPNGLAGIRTAATRSSPRAWVAAHRAAWPWAASIAVTAVVGAALASALLASGHRGAAVVVAWVPIVLTVAGAVPLVLAANRAARSV